MLQQCTRSQHLHAVRLENLKERHICYMRQPELNGLCYYSMVYQSHTVIEPNKISNEKDTAVLAWPFYISLQSNSSAGPKMSFDCLAAAAAVEVSGSSGMMSSQGACSSSGSCLGSINSVTASACVTCVMCPEPLASCTHPSHIKTSKCVQVGQAHCQGSMSSDAGIHAWNKVSPRRASPHNTGYFGSACLTAVHRNIN